MLKPFPLLSLSLRSREWNGIHLRIWDHIPELLIVDSGFRIIFHVFSSFRLFIHSVKFVQTEKVEKIQKKMEKFQKNGKLLS